MIMAGIRKVSMRAQCYEIIKDKILRQEFELGEEINIANLSLALSVSNTPIREALTQLESEGLVVSTLNAKPQVVFFTSESFRYISDTIAILVKGAYELCIRDNKISELLSLMELSLISQEEKLSSGDEYSFIEELVAFDQIVFDVLENPQLMAVFKRLSNVLFLMYRTNLHWHKMDGSHSISEHSKIVDTISGGSHEEVGRLVSEHYHKSYQDL